jgi:hypothetical protein
MEMEEEEKCGIQGLLNQIRPKARVIYLMVWNLYVTVLDMVWRSGERETLVRIKISTLVFRGANFRGIQLVP